MKNEGKNNDEVGKRGVNTIFRKRRTVTVLSEVLFMSAAATLYSSYKATKTGISGEILKFRILQYTENDWFEKFPVFKSSLPIQFFH